MVAVGRWWKETAPVLFFRTFDFLLFQIIFNQKEPLNFFLLLFQIIFNQKELFFKKGTIGKVWYIASLTRCFKGCSFFGGSVCVLFLKGVIFSCIFPIDNFQKIETYRKISSQQDNSNGGVEGKVVLDQLNFAEVEKVEDALDF